MQTLPEAAPPVYLISGELPGSGSTTLAQLLAEKVMAMSGVEPETVFVGKKLREALGVSTEEEMAEALQKVPDPSTFDPEIYDGLPSDRPVIVEGKLATRVGPQYISGRPLHLIDLTVHPFQSAIRVLQREGTPYENVFTAEGTFLEYFANVSRRSQHLDDLRSSEVATSTRGIDSREVYKHTFDTTYLSPQEIAESILGDGQREATLTGEEIEGITDFAARLTALAVKLSGPNQHLLDKNHYDYNFNNLLYQLKRLQTNANPLAAEVLRSDLRETIIDSVFSLFMRSVPRFYHPTSDGQILVDQESYQWSPEFYKIAMAMPTLKALLKGKSILDPFAGAGSLMFYLAAKEIPSEVVCSDLCFPGGEGIDDSGHNYSPVFNQQSIIALFTTLPSWCRPNFERMKGFVTANGTQLPLRDSSFDFVVGDPPYGLNCTRGSAQVLALALPELLRVAKEGVLTMVPEAWVSDLQRSPYKVTKLTEDLSGGSSNLPTCYLLIQDPKKTETYDQRTLFPNVALRV